MKLYVELKLRNDDHTGGFSNGLTMCGSQSTREMEFVSEDRDSIIYKNSKNYFVTLNTTRHDKILEVSTTFENRDTKTVTLEMLSSFAISGIKATKIHRLQSFWSAEGRIKTDTVEELQLEPSWNGCAMRVEKFGNLGSMPVRKYFPFIVLENEQTGEFIGVQLYIPSSWQIEIICREKEELTLTGGIADRDFGHWFKHIAPKEQFTTPKAVIAEGNSLYDVCDKLVRAQNPNISDCDRDMGIMFNEYCTTWGNPSFQNISRIADKLKNRGIKYLVIDSGWYGSNENWWECIGDWDINQQKFPGGFKAVTDYIRECGMIPGLWFEFESVGRGSSHFNDTEHLLKKDGVVITVGDKRFWDMADPWVIEYLYQSVITLLKESGFGYLKVDYNDTAGIGCDGAESLGEGLRQRVKATQDFFQMIRQEIPDIVIENCSSGGHRLEPSMMELASQASFSDAHEISSIPIIAANLHRAVKPSQCQIWAVMRAADDKNRIYYSMISTFLGRMCLSGDIYELSDTQWNLIEAGIQFYHQVSDIIKYGTTIRYENNVVSYNRPQGEQIVIREFADQLLVIVHRFENSTDIQTDFFKEFSIINSYGELNGDFSAKAYLLKKKNSKRYTT